MKKYNVILLVVACIYVMGIFMAGLLLREQSRKKSREYLVQINRLMKEMETAEEFALPVLEEEGQIAGVSFLPAGDLEEDASREAFFEKRNGLEIHVEPLLTDGVWKGLVRFDYTGTLQSGDIFWTVEGFLAISGLITMGILLFIKYKVLKPFLALSNMPYELSRGRLEADIEENKGRFFGKFVWGIAMLRDSLKASRLKALKLEKEKKLLLLSISHDIKTPLNTIRLYAKALAEGVYDTEEKRLRAAGQIEGLAGEIDSYVKEIVKTSSEEIVHVEVENTEFYLKDLVEMIQSYYEPKCRLMEISFTIGDFDNKLLCGSRDSAFEAVENIMENAFKYGDGKRIAITFSEEEYRQLIKIKNTGKPVGKEEMPHLFDGFYRGSNAGEKEGNGLGLYICREIMHKMGGEIFAEREKDGMNFQLVFPY